MVRTVGSKNLRTKAPGPTPARKKYACNVCGAEIVGYDLSRHYQKKTNEDQLNRLNAAVNDTMLKTIRKNCDPHTIYMFEKGLFSK